MIGAVELHEIKAPRTTSVARTAHQLIEVGISILITGDQLSVDDAGFHRQLQKSVGDELKALREVGAGFAVNEDLVAGLVQLGTLAVVLHLVNPLAAAGRLTA